MSSNPSLDKLTDQALLDQFGDLVQRNHHHTAALLRHVDAIDSRQLWAKYGHPSMFGFLVSRHHMSESTAAKRIGAARTARRFPILFDMVGRGEIHLSGIHRLKAHLTPEALPPPAAAPIAPLKTTPPLPAHAPRRAPDPEPLSPGRYKLQLTLDETSHHKLKQLQDLLAHQLPNGDPAVIIARALDALLAQVQQRKAAITDKPRSRKLDATRLSRAIPAAIRREVWSRDEGRCSFVGVDGHRCCETRGLEFAHRKPWAKGGEHSPDNLCLRCRAHNAWEADRDYGAGFMATKRSEPWKVREPLVSYDAGSVAGCFVAGRGKCTPLEDSLELGEFWADLRSHASISPSVAAMVDHYGCGRTFSPPSAARSGTTASTGSLLPTRGGAS